MTAPDEWTMRRKSVTAPIASATTLAQTESLIRAATLTLTEMDMDVLDTASRGIEQGRAARARNY